MFEFLKTRRSRKRARREAREFLTAFAAARDVDDGQKALDGLQALAAKGALPQPEVHATYVAAYALYADASIRDDLLNEAEAGVLSAIWRHIGTLVPNDLRGGDLVRANNRVQACLINTYGPFQVRWEEATKRSTGPETPS